MSLHEEVLRIFEENKTGKNDVLIICGPTGSGKSSLAISLRDKLDMELVSCDSMQIYKKMDIGTAKATKDEQNLVRHHMIDILEPWENYNAFLFKEQAEKCIEDIFNRGKVPVVCGGTGLYVNSLVDNREYVKDIDESKYSYLDNLSKEELYQKLLELDPEVTVDTHANNEKRVKRAVMLCLATGKTRRERNLESVAIPPKFNYITICLMPNRDALYEGIERRVDKMMEAGLATEVSNVWSMATAHVSYEDALKLTSFAAIGYREFIPIHDYSETDLKEISEKIKLNTRHYAKKQITWFKKTPGCIFLNID